MPMPGFIPQFIFAILPCSLQDCTLTKISAFNDEIYPFLIKLFYMSCDSGILIYDKDYYARKPGPMSGSSQAA